MAPDDHDPLGLPRPALPVAIGALTDVVLFLVDC
jgi:hypothetical protein